MPQQVLSAELAFDRARAGDEALHQIALSRLDIRLERMLLALPQPFALAHQRALRVEVHGVDRPASECAKRQRLAGAGARARRVTDRWC